MENQDKLEESSTAQDDKIDICESTIESDMSTEGSKDENENRKEKPTSKPCVNKKKPELLDLPDTLIRSILRYVSSPFDRSSATGNKKFCSPNATNNGCKVHGGVGGTCKRLHRLASERKNKNRTKKKDSTKMTVDLPIRNLEIPVGQEQLRLTYGDDDPSEKWTHCYNSIDKIISSSPWLRHLTIKEYYNTVHTTHLISLALDTASRYCCNKGQLQNLSICSYETQQSSSSTTLKNDSMDVSDTQACASSTLSRRPGSIDWEGFTRFASSCGGNITTLEIDNINFKDVMKPCDNVFSGEKMEIEKRKAESQVKESFDHFKKLQNLTLKITKTNGGRNSGCQIHIAPIILSCSFMQTSLRILKISLTDFPDGDTSSFSNALSTCYKLEELSLRFAEQLTGRDINSISTLPKLRRLGISKANKLSSSDLIDSFSDTKTQFTKLSSLSLVLCSGINVHSLEAILGNDSTDGSNGRSLQDLDIYADGLGDSVLSEMQKDREENLSYLSYLKILCANYFAINVTLLGATPGVFFKLSNLEKLDNKSAKPTKQDMQTWWSKLRKLRRNTNNQMVNKNQKLTGTYMDTSISSEAAVPTPPPPSPPPEYSNFSVLDSNISCHIKSVPTVVLSPPSFSKCR